MFKKSHKIFAIVIALLLLMTTACYAEDVELYAEDSEASTTSELVITEDSVEKDSAEAVDSEEEIYTTGEGADDLTTKLEEMLNSDLFLIDQEVKYDNIVDGNAYIIGNTVSFDSIIGGNVFILGNEVTIEENAFIYASLYILANKVTINGSVYGGDLYVACSELTISGSGAVARDIRAATSKFTFDGGVGRNLYVVSSDISIGESAQIIGDLNYTSSEAIQVPAGVVGGSINYTEATSEDIETNSNPVASYFYDLVQLLVVVLAALGLMILVAPGYLGKVENFEAKGILPSLGIGAIGLIIGIPFLVIAILSVIGVSVGFSLFALWLLLAFVLSVPVAVISIASVLAKKVEALNKWHNIFAVAITAIVVWAIGLIPYIGGLVTFALYLYGFGLAIRCILKNRNVVKKEESAQ